MNRAVEKQLEFVISTFQTKATPEFRRRRRDRRRAASGRRDRVPHHDLAGSHRQRHRQDGGLPKSQGWDPAQVGLAAWLRFSSQPPVVVAILGRNGHRHILPKPNDYNSPNSMNLTTPIHILQLQFIEFSEFFTKQMMLRILETFILY